MEQGRRGTWPQNPWLATDAGPSPNPEPGEPPLWHWTHSAGLSPESCEARHSKESDTLRSAVVVTVTTPLGLIEEDVCARKHLLLLEAPRVRPLVGLGLS